MDDAVLAEGQHLDAGLGPKSSPAPLETRSARHSWATVLQRSETDRAERKRSGGALNVLLPRPHFAVIPTPAVRPPEPDGAPELQMTFD